MATIVIGITGSIAAYKAADITSALVPIIYEEPYLSASTFYEGSGVVAVCLK